MNDPLQGSRIPYQLILVSTFSLILFQERVVVHVQGEGRGNLQLIGIFFPIVVFGLFLLFQVHRPFGFLRQPEFWKIWAPFILLSILLPLLGVLSGDYPARSLLTIWQGLLPLALIAAGALGTWQGQDSAWPGTLLFLAILLHASLAVIQVIPIITEAHLGPLQAILNWDLDFKRVFNEQNVIVGRATGFYVNPNSLGVWGCLSFWAAALFLHGWKRTIGISATLISLLLCTSRGSLLAFIISLICWLLVRNHRAKFFHVLNLRLYTSNYIYLFMILLIISIFFSNNYTLLDNSRFFNSMLDRFSTGVNILTQGASADQNFLGRVNAWKIGSDFYMSHPWGTFGSPQYALKSVIDNDYVRIILQGSVFYICAHVFMLIKSFLFIKSESSIEQFLGVSATIFIVNSFTAAPLTYISSSLYWVVVGAYLAVPNRSPLRAGPGPRP